MGKIDTEAKSYLSNPDRFSDIFNFWIYDGIKVIKPEELQELDTNSLAIPYQHKIKKHVQKYRDLLKLYTAKQDQHNIYLILGIEIEAKTHYAMPVRNMLYDAMNYAKQVSDLADYHAKSHTRMTSDEFLSGLLESDRLRPVITLVFNVSGTPWTGATSIHDLLNTQDKQILQFVPNYKMNLLSPDMLDESDFEKFHTGLGAALQFLKHQQDENMDWLNNQKRLESVDRATAEFIQVATGTDLQIDEQDEVINVCKAWENSMNQAKAAGKAEGEKNADRRTALRMLKKNKPIEEILEWVDLSRDEIDKLAQQLQ